MLESHCLVPTVTHSSDSGYDKLEGYPSFKFRSLRQFLSVITDQIDLSAVALTLYSNEVIELQTAQEILQSTEVGVQEEIKVLEIFGQLQKRKDLIPFFLRSLLDSGETSSANRKLYELLSENMDFSDTDVNEACEMEYFKRRSVSCIKKRACIMKQSYLPRLYIY